MPTRDDANTGLDGTGWNCDECGQRITKAGDGWLEWFSRVQEDPGDPLRYMSGREMRIVHHPDASPRRQQRGREGCYAEGRKYLTEGFTLAGGHLASFLGADGLTQLLSMIQTGEAPKAEVLEIIKRLHTPKYESARPYLKQAISEGTIEPNLPTGFYWQDELSAVVAEYSQG